MDGLVTVDLKAVEDHIKVKTKHFHHICAIYLFGSVLEQMRPDSDIDVALIADRFLNDKTAVAIQSEVEETLGCFEGHPFDVTVLHRGSKSLFAFRVLDEGKVVFVGDRDQYTDFLERTARRYGEVNFRYQRALKEVLEDV